MGWVPIVCAQRARVNMLVVCWALVVRDRVHYFVSRLSYIYRALVYEHPHVATRVAATWHSARHGASSVSNMLENEGDLVKGGNGGRQRPRLVLHHHQAESAAACLHRLVRMCMRVVPVRDWQHGKAEAVS